LRRRPRLLLPTRPLRLRLPSKATIRASTLPSRRPTRPRLTSRGSCFSSGPTSPSPRAEAIWTSALHLTAEAVSVAGSTRRTPFQRRALSSCCRLKAAVLFHQPHNGSTGERPCNLLVAGRLEGPFRAQIEVARTGAGPWDNWIGLSTIG